MASIRKLKKDVDYLTMAVVADTLNFGANSKDKAQVAELVRDTIAKRNELRAKLNKRQKFENRKESKAYYNEIVVDMMKSVDEKFSILSGLVKANKE